MQPGHGLRRSASSRRLEDRVQVWSASAPMRLMQGDNGGLPPTETTMTIVNNSKSHDSNCGNDNNGADMMEHLHFAPPAPTTLQYSTSLPNPQLEHRQHEMFAASSFRASSPSLGLSSSLQPQQGETLEEERKRLLAMLRGDGLGTMTKTSSRSIESTTTVETEAESNADESKNSKKNESTMPATTERGSWWRRSRSGKNGGKDHEHQQTQPSPNSSQLSSQTTRPKDTDKPRKEKKWFKRHNKLRNKMEPDEAEKKSNSTQRLLWRSNHRRGGQKNQAERNQTEPDHHQNCVHQHGGKAPIEATPPPPAASELRRNVSLGAFVFGGASDDSVAPTVFRRQTSCSAVMEQRTAEPGQQAFVYRQHGYGAYNGVDVSPAGDTESQGHGNMFVPIDQQQDAADSPKPNDPSSTVDSLEASPLPPPLLQRRSSLFSRVLRKGSQNDGTEGSGSNNGNGSEVDTAKAPSKTPNRHWANTQSSDDPPQTPVRKPPTPTNEFPSPAPPQLERKTSLLRRMFNQKQNKNEDQQKTSSTTETRLVKAHTGTSHVQSSSTPRTQRVNNQYYDFAPLAPQASREGQSFRPVDVSPCTPPCRWSPCPSPSVELVVTHQDSHPKLPIRRHQQDEEFTPLLSADQHSISQAPNNPYIFVPQPTRPSESGQVQFQTVEATSIRVSNSSINLPPKVTSYAPAGSLRDDEYDQEVSLLSGVPSSPDSGQNKAKDQYKVEEIAPMPKGILKRPSSVSTISTTSTTPSPPSMLAGYRTPSPGCRSCAIHELEDARQIQVSPSPPSPSVRFGYAQIREYERTVGDNPTASGGLALSIGWKCLSTYQCKLDDYERSRLPVRRPNQRDLYVRPEERESLLAEWRCSRRELERRRREAMYIQYQRGKVKGSKSSKKASKPQNRQTYSPNELNWPLHMASPINTSDCHQPDISDTSQPFSESGDITNQTHIVQTTTHQHVRVISSSPVTDEMMQFQNGLE